MRLFSPRKTTLMFVIRDKTRVCSLLSLDAACFFLIPKKLRYLVCFVPWNDNCFSVCIYADTFGKPGAGFKRRHSEGTSYAVFMWLMDLIRIGFWSYSCITLPMPPLLKIWDSVPKPQAHKETPLSEFFNVRCWQVDQFYVLKNL